MVINGLHNDVTDDRDGCYTTGADGMKTGSWRQSRRSANGGGSSGSSMIAGGRGPGAEICDGSGRRPYMTADDEWTCRRVLLSASAVPHTCGEDDNTVSTLMDRYSSVMNSSSQLPVVDYSAYCPVCAPPSSSSALIEVGRHHYSHYATSPIDHVTPATTPQGDVVNHTESTRNYATGRPSTAARVLDDSTVITPRPDLLRPTTISEMVAATRSPLRSSASSRRSLSSSAPDLIELSRLQVSTDAENETSDDEEDNDEDQCSYHRRSRMSSTTLPPPRRARHASVVWSDRKPIETMATNMFS